MVRAQFYIAIISAVCAFVYLMLYHQRAVCEAKGGHIERVWSLARQSHVCIGIDGRLIK